ncbi:hypothetical protein GCM10017559_61180 [Streptosporangium longisporum]|uniref:Uncharacterized protein n=1 Tax=Streptosporangium longisporum TaxID=46187 RepID=A0ABP6L3P3_9ACTN
MSPRRRPPHLLIDPSLPPTVASALRADATALRAARRGHAPPPKLPSTPRVCATLLFLLFLMGLSLTAGLIVISIAIFLSSMSRLSGDVKGHRAWRRFRTAMRHRDRYILPEDLDPDCGDLLRRTQEATETVLDSEVNKANLLDTIDNAVTLPDQTWQIASKLKRLSELRADHRRLMPDPLPPGIADAFAPYTAALETAERSLDARIRTLEEYAGQVRRADDVYRAHRRLQELAEQAPRYEALVAETTEDALAAPGLGQLTEQARQVERLFQESIDEARLTARHLLPAAGP